MPSAVAATIAAPSASTREALLAARNAFKLGGALVATWGVALAVRILLPRYLGPGLFGPLTFADAFATLFFIPLDLGVDTYIRKEVSVRPAHASDFFGGVFLLRALVSAALFGAIAVVMAATDRPPEVRRVVYVFAAGQTLVALNNSLSALLHSRGRVGGLSITSVAAKLVWAAGVLGALALRAGLVWIALAFLVAEAIKSTSFTLLARRALDLRMRVDLGATWAVLAAALPFYVNTLASSAYARLDISVLSFSVDDPVEVGLYGAASSLAGLTLLVAPLIGWVLTPLFSRALARSDADFEQALCRALQLILVVAIPAGMMVSLGADVWVRVMFGAAFAPAAASLRVLAPVFVLTYVATVNAIALVLLGRGWTLTRISLGGMALNLALNLVLAPLGFALLGRSGGGVGCALAMVVTEGCVTALLLRSVSGRAFDSASLTALAKSLLACAVVFGLDHALAGLGPARLLLDAGAYLLVVLALGALPVRELLSFARALRSQP